MRDNPMAEVSSGRFIVRVWDLPTRVFHWTLACAVVGAILLAKVGGNAMVWHFRCGYVVCALLVFRAVWGVVGGRWSRFASFVYGPSAMIDYVLRKQSTEGQRAEVGHSPSGAVSVFAMLGVLSVQVVSGLMADDEISNAGPLSHLVSGKAVAAMTHWHAGWGQWLIISLVAAHVIAIDYYRKRGRSDLVPAMIHGNKTLGWAEVGSVDTWSTRVAAAVVAAGAIGAAFFIAHMGD